MPSDRTLLGLPTASLLLLGTLPASAGTWIGMSIRVLPPRCVTYYHGGSAWFISGGMWYHSVGRTFVGCYPPVGLSLTVLPLGFRTVWVGGVRYYCVEDVYYTDGPGGTYLVAAPPAPAARPAPEPVRGDELDILMILPLKHQDLDQMKQDRREAREYARRESGYDPSEGPAEGARAQKARRNYILALREYFEDHGYSVR